MDRQFDEDILLSTVGLSEQSKRKQEEEEFHDHLRGGDHGPLPNRKFYAIDAPRLRANEAVLRPVLAAGGRILDFGCGNGSFAIWMAQQGGLVSAVDISSVSIEGARERAEGMGLTDRVSFRVMDAEQLQFRDESFDAVLIFGVLHHLDLREAYAEIARVLKPGGVAVATEACRHNPFIRWYRRRTPDLRTEWEAEHILGKPEVELARDYFGDIRIQHFHLAALAAVPLRNTKVFEPVLRVLTALDQYVLLRIPGLRWWAWQTLFEMRDPRKPKKT